jgi:hypothetical protein
MEKCEYSKKIPLRRVTLEMRLDDSRQKSDVQRTKVYH